MRIIAGKARGTGLVKFREKQIRPTLDRVKESLFSQIQPYLENARFLDSFAGTGAIGLEAWSRGAESVVLVEKDSRAFAIVCKNMDKCKSKDTVTAIFSDIFEAMFVLESNEELFDIIYVDPPFHLKLHDIFLEKLSASSIIKITSIIIVEHHQKTVLQNSYGKMFLSRRRKVGDTLLSFYGFHQLFS